VRKSVLDRYALYEEGKTGGTRGAEFLRKEDQLGRKKTGVKNSLIRSKKILLGVPAFRYRSLAARHL